MGYKNPVISIAGVDHGDPAVLKFNGMYYLYHTGGTEVPVYRSTDLVNWEKCGAALQASEDPDHWAQIDLWAPEVIFENGTFYMYVTGAKKKEDGTANDDIRRIGVATSQSPTGPFTLSPRPLTSEWSIDAHPFKDEDGTFYMFYNVRNEYTRGPGGYIGCGNVVDRMIDLTTLSGNPTMVVKPEFLWEGNKEKTWFWNEGPFVLKKDGVYYQMYSAGHFADDTYGVYYATSTVPMGTGGMEDRSWAKWRGGKAILETNEHCLGPGHHVVVKGPNGIEDYAVYHGYEKGEKTRERRVRVGRLEWRGDKLWIEPPSGDELSIPAGPTYDGRFIDSVKDLNKGLSQHKLEAYLFETNIRLDESGGWAGGEAFAQGASNKVEWRLCAEDRSFRVKQTVEGEVRSEVRVPIREGFNVTVYHHLKIIKNVDHITFYLDGLFIYALVSELEKGATGKGFFCQEFANQLGTTRLDQEGASRYKGTILENLPKEKG
jgi:GH43 family beta-xylosidase